MSTQPDALHESTFRPQEAATVAISGWQRFYWCVRRELWENHSLYVAPLVVAGVVLLGFLITVIRMAPQADLQGFIATRGSQAILFPYNVVAGLVMLTVGIVSLFYCLEALHGERSDRSILFWKSLPVSDLTTVLAKASVPLLILPTIAFAVTITTQILMLLLFSAVRHGGTDAAPWMHAPLLPMSLMLLYHLFAVHSLWYAPLYGWLLLVSAWARRAAILWAFVPPLALVLLALAG